MQLLLTAFIMAPFFYGNLSLIFGWFLMVAFFICCLLTLTVCLSPSFHSKHPLPCSFVSLPIQLSFMRTQFLPSSFSSLSPSRPFPAHFYHSSPELLSYTKKLNLHIIYMIWRHILNVSQLKRLFICSFKRWLFLFSATPIRVVVFTSVTRVFFFFGGGSYLSRESRVC